jgi:hypothetical protein
VELLEVLHDRERLGEMAAVVELEHGQATERVLREELEESVLSAQDVDGLERHVETLLRQVDAQLLRIRRAGESYLHVSSPTPHASPGEASGERRQWKSWKEDDQLAGDRDQTSVRR